MMIERADCIEYLAEAAAHLDTDTVSATDLRTARSGVLCSSRERLTAVSIIYHHIIACSLEDLGGVK